MNIADKYGTPAYRRAVVELYTRYLAWVDAGKLEHDDYREGRGLCAQLLYEGYPIQYLDMHVQHILNIYTVASPFTSSRHGTYEAAQLARENHVRTYLSHHAQEFAA